MIEYILNSDGRPGKAWNPYTGCLHTQAQCPTAATCWARDLARRFPQAAGGDFQPRYHSERLGEPLKWRKSQTVAVCFMGELFGPWDLAETDNYGWPKTDYLPMAYIRKQILDSVRICSQHRFLFLTKAPQNLARFNPWPPNAWVGITITGAETPERQRAMYDALMKVEGGHRWLSYEPMLGRLEVPLGGIEWLVMGAQSGRGAMKPEWAWLELEGEAWAVSIPIWEKKNLAKALDYENPLQEVP